MSPNICILQVLFAPAGHGQPTVVAVVVGTTAFATCGLVSEPWRSGLLIIIAKNLLIIKNYIVRFLLLEFALSVQNINVPTHP